MIQETGTPIHFVMRFADQVLSISDMIQEHNNIIDRYGAVWIGRLGRRIAKRQLLKINEQCKKRVPTYLYLVKQEGRDYKAYRGVVVNMAYSVPQNEKRLIPPYYEKQGVVRQMRLWTKVSKIRDLDRYELNELRVATSGAPLTDSLKRSMSGFFFVRRRQGI